MVQRMYDSTRAVHPPDQERDGPLVQPIVAASTFLAPSQHELDERYEGRSPGLLYTRYGNPTVAHAAAHLAALEGTEGAILCGSGMAAITLILLGLCRAGGRVVASGDLYGGTTKLFRTLLPRLGMTVETFASDDVAGLARLLERPAELVYLESPTNPTLRLVPLDEVATVARAHGVPTAVDSTFATPILCKPARLGVDVIVHSATKFLGGHSDLLGGAVCASGAHLAALEATHRMTGALLDPHAAFLLDRGVKTLALRVACASTNALHLAHVLAAHPKVTRVHYPGHPSHPQHALARRLLVGGFGGVLSFDLAGGAPAARRFADALGLVRNAASLGGVESLVTLPVVQSHRGQAEADLARSGISPGTVRLSIGIEDLRDLEADLAQALERA